MNKFISGLQSLWSSVIATAASVAVMSMAVTPIAVQAQSAPPAASSIYTDVVDPPALEFLGLRQYIRGVPLSEAQYGELRDLGCTVGPRALVRALVEEAKEEGWMCAPRFFARLDNLAREGTTLTIVYLSGSGATVVENVKGNNTSQNYLQISTFSLAANSDGRPLTVTYNYHANGGQYMAQMLSSLPGTILGASLPQLVSAAVSGDCDGRCQSGDIIMVSANSGSSSIAANQTSQTTTVGTAAPCGSAPCAGTLPPGHTQD